MSPSRERIVLSLLLASSMAAHAIEFEALTPRFGVALVANGVPTTDSAAGPIAGTVGLGFPVRIAPGSALSFEPGFDVFSYHSGLLETQPATGPVLELPRAVPVPAESASSSWTAGLLLQAPFVFSPRLAGTFMPAFGLGPAILVRVAAGGPTPLELNAWFFGKARWLYGEALIGFEVELAPRMSLAGGIRGLYPLANLWTDGDPAMALDGAILHLSLGMRLSFGSPDEEAPPPGGGSVEDGGSAADSAAP